MNSSNNFSRINFFKKYNIHDSVKHEKNYKLL